MTTAPPNLLAVRALIRPPFGLTAVETGIAPDPAHRGGYHCGRPQVPTDDYSYDESKRDGPSLTEYACALDVGYWEKRVAGKSHSLRSMSVWLVAQCKANAPDTRDIREIIYSADGKSVRRWDRLGKRTTGDSSHLSHTHISFHRDAIKAGRDQRSLFTRYLTEIGLLAPAPRKDDDPMRYLVLAREKGAREVYAGDGVTRRWVRTEEELAGLQWWMRQRGATDTAVHEFAPGTLGVLGEDITAAPPAPAS